MSLTKPCTKELFLYAINHLDDPKYAPIFNDYFLYVVKDICLFKLQRYYAQKPKSSNYIVVQFDNKMGENVNLAYIMNSKHITKLFPHQSANMSSPKTSYSYTRTIRLSNTEL